MNQSINHKSYRLVDIDFSHVHDIENRVAHHFAKYPGRNGEKSEEGEEQNEEKAEVDVEQGQEGKTEWEEQK
jgi:hypothetical protein